jgi:hypothetical protein
MPDTVQHSSSKRFVFLKHSLLASRIPSPQLQPASLTEYPSSHLTEQHHNGASVVGQRPLRGVGQDKGASDAAPLKTQQPAPVTEVVRSSLNDTSAARVQNHLSVKERKVRGSIWMKPGVKSALQRLADQDNLSFSEMCATALEVFARWKIHKQEEALFEPRFRKIAREENRSLGNRLVFFEMRNAIAAEQTRILTTDLYKRQLQKEGISQAKIEEKVDQAYTLARSNVLKKTPQLTALLDAWWQTSDADVVGEADTGRRKTEA